MQSANMAWHGERWRGTEGRSGDAALGRNEGGAHLSTNAADWFSRLTHTPSLRKHNVSRQAQRQQLEEGCELLIGGALPAAMCPRSRPFLLEVANCSLPKWVEQLRAEGAGSKQLLGKAVLAQLTAAHALLGGMCEPLEALVTVKAVTMLVAAHHEDMSVQALRLARSLLFKSGQAKGLPQVVASDCQLAAAVVAGAMCCLKALGVDRESCGRSEESPLAAATASLELLWCMVCLFGPSQWEAYVEECRWAMSTCSGLATLALSRQQGGPLEATCCEQWLTLVYLALWVLTAVMQPPLTVSSGSGGSAPAANPQQLAGDLPGQLVAFCVDLASLALRHVCALGRKVGDGRHAADPELWQSEPLLLGAEICLSAALAMLEAAPLWEQALQVAAAVGPVGIPTAACRRPVRRCTRQVLSLAAYGIFAKLDISPYADAAKLARLAQGVARVREEIQAATLPPGEADVPRLCELVFWRFCPPTGAQEHQQQGGARNCRDPKLAARLQKRLQQRQQRQACGGEGPGEGQAGAERREADAAAAAESLLREEEAAAAAAKQATASKAPKKRAKKKQQGRRQQQEEEQQEEQQEQAREARGELPQSEECAQPTAKGREALDRPLHSQAVIRINASSVWAADVAQEGLQQQGEPRAAPLAAAGPAQRQSCLAHGSGDVGTPQRSTACQPSSPSPRRRHQGSSCPAAAVCSPQRCSPAERQLQPPQQPAATASSAPEPSRPAEEELLLPLLLAQLGLQQQCRPQQEQQLALAAEEPCGTSCRPRPPIFAQPLNVQAGTGGAAAAAAAAPQWQPQPTAAGSGQATAGCARFGDDDCCVVCMEGEKDTVLVPCGHQALCVPCTAGMFGDVSTGQPRPCPICKADVTLWVRCFRA